MNRRIFQQTLAAAAASMSFSFPAAVAPRRAAKKIIKPPRLPEGGRIGLVAPASPFSDDQWQRTIANFEGMGFRLQYDEASIRSRYGYLAGADSRRVNEIHAFFADKNVDALWCVRGGYGSARLLPMLDYGLIRRHPKIVVGYSDITALLNGIFGETGLVGFHGPVGTSKYPEYTRQHTLPLLMQPDAAPYRIELSKEIETATDKLEYTPFTIKGGTAEGQLAGGNLTLIAALQGTRYAPDFAGKIVLLEEIGEKPYRVDRLLTQLLQSGALAGARAVALGVFADCQPDEGDSSLPLADALRDRLEGLGVPVGYGFSFGHIGQQFTFPIGVDARVDTNTMTLELTEAAVV